MTDRRRRRTLAAIAELPLLLHLTRERERDRGMREVREGGRDGEYKEAGDAKQR